MNFSCSLPKFAAAPINAYLPGWTNNQCGNNVVIPMAINLPHAAPTNNIGMKMPSDTLNPYVMHESG